MATNLISLDRALNTPGWMDPAELKYLAHLSHSAPPGSFIVEVGSFKGRSACALALNPGILLYCVDPWTKYSFGDFTECYAEFRENTAHLTNVVPVVKYSSDAADMFAWERRKFHVIFIDGDHTAEHVRSDIEKWRPLLADGGILCGHDYGRPDWPDVEPVVREMVPNHCVVPGTSIWTTEGC
jgi:predicted O-methyltransferase YrrM